MSPHRLSHALRRNISEKVYDILGNDSLVFLHNAHPCTVHKRPAPRSEEKATASN